MKNKVNITKAAELAGVSRTHIYTLLDKGLLSKTSDKKIEISELLRVFPDIYIDEKDNQKNNNLDVTLQHKNALLELENKYLKEKNDYLNKELDSIKNEKRKLIDLLESQNRLLPKPKKWGFF